MADTLTICLAVAGLILDLGTGQIELRWTHSVQRTSWSEGWQVEDGRLALVWAQVEGSGAGMEPGEDAVRTDRGWRWHPVMEPLAALDLARSNATEDWRICRSEACATVEELTGVRRGQPARLSPCRSEDR